MIKLQKFKETDNLESQVNTAFLSFPNLRSSEVSNLFNGVFECFVLGDVLYALKRDPLAGVVTQNTFRSSFFAIHKLFTRPGTFEFYLEVFRAVWGNEVNVTFSIPDPGKLLISIEALSIRLENLLTRKIEDNEYIYDEIVDHNGDEIMLQGAQGVKTETEAQALVRELHPAGVYVQTTLIIS